MSNSTERPSVTEDNESRKDTTSLPAVIKTPPQPDGVISKEAEDYETYYDKSFFDNICFGDIAVLGKIKPEYLFTPEEHEKYDAYEKQYYNEKKGDGCDICCPTEPPKLEHKINLKELKDSLPINLDHTKQPTIE